MTYLVEYSRPAEKFIKKSRKNKWLFAEFKLINSHLGVNWQDLKAEQPSGDLQINIWESGEINSRIMAGDYETTFNPGELTKPQKLAAILAKIKAE